MRVRVLLNVLIVIGVIAPGVLRAQEEEEEETSIEIGDGSEPDAEEEDGPGFVLRELLEAYDRRGGGNTIPIEREILRLMQAREYAALAEFLGHARFGGTIAWALSECAGPESQDRLLTAYSAWPLPLQAGAACWIATLRTDGARAALRKVADRNDLNPWQRQQVRAGLLRAGDPAARTWLDESLRSREMATIASALLVAAAAREHDALPEIAKLVGDTRPLERPVRSHFGVETRTTDSNGNVIVRNTKPDCTNLGQLAVEAANRLVRPITPEFIAWWYEPDGGAYFGRLPDATGRLRDYLAADAKARAAGALRAHEAAAAFRQALRGQRGVRIEAMRFDREWRIESVIGGAPLLATVDGEGRVSMPIRVPAGRTPVVDGSLDEEEWDGSRELSLEGNATLLLRQDEEAVYLAIRTPRPALASVAVAVGDSIHILHASGSLGTATYERGDAGKWTRRRAFDWRCREGRSSDQQRQEFERAEGWLANTMGMGRPGFVEFKIAKRFAPGGELRVSFALLGGCRWPDHLDDGSANTDLLRGEAPAELRFAPERWVVLGL